MTRPSWLQAAIDKHVDPAGLAEERTVRARLQSVARTDPAKFKADMRARRDGKPAKKAAKKKA